MVLVREIIQKEFMHVNANCSFEHAIQTMHKNGQGSVVIIENNTPVGILTERDLVSLIQDETNFDTKVSILGKKHIVTVNHNRSVEYALHVLVDNNIRRLVIVDDNNFFLGVVTQDKIIEYLEEESYKVNLIVSQILPPSKKIISLTQDRTILDTLNLMQDNNIGSVVVVDDKENPIGIFTERDTIKIANKHITLTTQLSEVMSKPVITVEADLKVKDVAAFMNEKHIRRVLVKNGDKIEGIVGIRDIAQNLKGNYGQILESKLKNIKITLNHIGELVLEIYEDNNRHIIQWVNDTAVKYFGKEILDKPIDDVLIERAIWKEIRNILKNDGKCHKMKINIGTFYFELMCSYHFVNQKETILIILRDISEFEYKITNEVAKRKSVEKELSILQNVIDQQDNIIIVTDGKDILEVNKKFLDFYSVRDIYSFKKEFGTIDRTFICHQDFYCRQDGKESWIEEIQKLPIENRIVSIVDPATIEPKAFTVQINSLNDNYGSYVVTFTDITNIKLESQKHYYHATHDIMTGLYNRAYYLDKLDNELVNAQRYNKNFSLIIFDIDHFKNVNDTYGHLKGDEVIVAVADTALKNIRKNDFVARWGGEEFIVLLPETAISSAELIAENLKKSIENIKVEGVENVSASFGVTQYIKNDDEKTIVKRADEALYEAKKTGRNKVISK